MGFSDWRPERQLQLTTTGLSVQLREFLCKHLSALYRNTTLHCSHWQQVNPVPRSGFLNTIFLYKQLGFFREMANSRVESKNMQNDLGASSNVRKCFKKKKKHWLVWRSGANAGL